jgi:Uma2 family endonuclease
MGRTAAQAFPLESDRLYSLEEFEELDLPASDGNKYELIDGVLKVSPPAGYGHGMIGSRIVRRITLFDPDGKLGQFLQATRFAIAPGFGPAPDVAFITAAHLPPETRGAVPTRPDLAVEVWSPGDLDTKAHQAEARAKVRRYQVAGVPIVWAINPLERKVEVYHPGQAGPVQVLGVGEELSGEDVIPGFTMKVAALFE